MTSTVFAAPILPGKTEAWKQAMAEIKGPRKNAYIEARKSLGISKEVACLQQTPQGDVVAVYIEAVDTTNILQNMLNADDEFHRWFARAVLQDVHGIDSSQSAPPSNELFINLL